MFNHPRESIDEGFWEYHSGIIARPRTSYGGLIQCPLSQMSLGGINMIGGHLAVESVKQSIVREAALKLAFVSRQRTIEHQIHKADAPQYTREPQAEELHQDSRDPSNYELRSN